MAFNLTKMNLVCWHRKLPERLVWTVGSPSKQMLFHGKLPKSQNTVIGKYRCLYPISIVQVLFISLIFLVNSACQNISLRRPQSSAPIRKSKILQEIGIQPGQKSHARGETWEQVNLNKVPIGHYSIILNQCLSPLIQKHSVLSLSKTKILITKATDVFHKRTFTDS